MKKWISGIILMLCATGAFACPVTDLVENFSCAPEVDEAFTVRVPYLWSEKNPDLYGIFEHVSGGTWRVSALGPREAIRKELQEDDPRIPFVPASFAVWCQDSGTMLFEDIVLPDGETLEAVVLRQHPDNILLWTLDPGAECDFP